MQELLGKTMKSFAEGSIVKGRVLQKRTNEILVDIGYKSEGVISLSEFEDDEPLEVGTEILLVLLALYGLGVGYQMGYVDGRTSGFSATEVLKELGRQGWSIRKNQKGRLLACRKEF